MVAIRDYSPIYLGTRMGVARRLSVVHNILDLDSDLDLLHIFHPILFWKYISQLG